MRRIGTSSQAAAEPEGGRPKAQSLRPRPLSRAALLALFASLLGLFVFFVAPAMAAAPDVTITSVGTPTYTTVHVEGEVDPHGEPIYWSYEVSADGGASWQPTNVGNGYTESAEAADGDIEGLTAGKTYQVRLAASSYNDGSQGFSAEPNPQFTTESVNAPTVTLDPVTTFTGTTVHLGGRIEPNPVAGDPPASDVAWHFECTPVCPGLVGGSVAAGAEGGDQLVSEEASGLEPNTEYTVRLIGKNAGEPVEAGPLSFTTATTAPVVETLPAFALAGGTEALLGGTINPRNSETTYWVEWGPTPGYGQRVPATPAAAGSGNQVINVTQRIAGLSPSTVYHARLVGESNGVSTHGADVSFETAAVSSAIQGGCANAQLRDENSSTELPDCRAYEMVSPRDKNGVDVGRRGNAPVYVAAADGERLAFETYASLPGAASSKINNENLSTRGTDHWSTQTISPPAPEREFAFWGYFQHFNADLTQAVVNGPPRLPLAPGAIEDSQNLFLRDGATGRYVTLSRAAVTGANSERFLYYGESADSSHVVFEAVGALTPGAIPLPEAQANIYEWVGGQLRLVSVLPNGEPAPHGTTNLYLSAQPLPVHPVSQDGSRIVFQAPMGNGGASAPIYLREDGTRTIEVSRSQRAVPDVEETPSLVGASADGSKIVFTTRAEALTEDAEVGKGAIYRYDVGSGVLEDVTAVGSWGGSSAVTFSVLGMSEDASYIYFQRVETGKIYLFHDGEIRYIGVGQFGEYLQHAVRVSPSGRYLAFVTRSRMTAYDNKEAETGEPEGEIYRYDADTNRLICASCRPDGSPPSAAAFFPAPPEFQRPDLQRTLLDDGTVFFESEDAVVAADTNGLGDAYEMRDGRVALLSSGTSGDVSGFAGASLDGRDAFIFTRQQLVPSDTDHNRDLYDARIGGGFPAPTTASGVCAGDECQGQASPPPAASSPASAGLRSPDRVRPKNTHKKRHKRHHKKHHKPLRNCRVPKKASKGKHHPKHCKELTTKTSKGGNR